MASDLLVRAVSGLVLATVAIGAVWAGDIWFVLFCAVAGAAMGYEGARLATKDRGAPRPGVFIALGVATPVALLGGYSLTVSIIAIGAFAVGLLAEPAQRRLSVGLALYVAIPLALIVGLRLAPSGLERILFLFLVVWTTDVAAFLAGKGFGGPRLAPDGSPNKTWSGWGGAVLCALLAGAAGAPLLGANVVWGASLGAILSIAAQAGDLLESRLKRNAGLKDTSGFIPGHGGVLDRVDGLMAATAVFALWPIVDAVFLL